MFCVTFIPSPLQSSLLSSPVFHSPPVSHSQSVIVVVQCSPFVLADLSVVELHVHHCGSSFAAF